MIALATIPKTKKEHLERRIALYLDNALIYGASTDSYRLHSMFAKEMDDLVAALTNIAIDELSYPPTP